eukprot:gnl/MRDRNA2_/MRDRNA2_33488_c0_seq1.p1 gnl/MRDRNA2_/MRDRNA2_33488_c0~~gnl/MRDRNA2_/MRDRNA2_33488_c0_seq1.p1  ORF type:complete len:298 (-),score=66.84 gnl/MRDRNA2_/MRDRNA2_33488_c0_seq1:117-1010(-)
MTKRNFDMALLEAFGQPTPAEVAEAVDKNDNGHISLAELKGFFEAVATEQPPHEALVKIMDNIAGEDQVASIPRTKFAEWLDGEGFEAFERVSCDPYILNSLIQQKQGISCSGRFSQIVLRCSRRGRMRLCGQRARESIFQQIQQEQMELLEKRAQKRAQEVEQQARARSMPNRETDFSLLVKCQINKEKSFVEATVDVSCEDTLDDVLARYMSAMKEKGASESEIYNPINQPGWLVVQQGSEVSSKGFAVQNFSMQVSELKITSKDNLTFISPSLQTHEVFFKEYKRRDAMKTPRR